jgi:hypothetical protein
VLFCPCLVLLCSVIVFYFFCVEIDCIIIRVFICLFIATLTMTREITSGHQGLPQMVHGPNYISGLDRNKGNSNRRVPQTQRSRSRSPLNSKRAHTLSESSSDSLNMNRIRSFPISLTRPTIHNFLLTNYDSKFQNQEHVFMQITKFGSRSLITQIITSRNGYILKCTDPNLMLVIRDKCSY